MGSGPGRGGGGRQKMGEMKSLMIRGLFFCFDK